MISEELKTIIDKLNDQGKMAFLEGATEEQMAQFEKDHEIILPKNIRSGSSTLMGVSSFYQQECNSMVLHTSP